MNRYEKNTVQRLRFFRRRFQRIFHERGYQVFFRYSSIRQFNVRCARTALGEIRSDRREIHDLYIITSQIRELTIT